MIQGSSTGYTEIRWISLQNKGKGLCHGWWSPFLSLLIGILHQMNQSGTHHHPRSYGIGKTHFAALLADPPAHRRSSAPVSPTKSTVAWTSARERPRQTIPNGHHVLCHPDRYLQCRRTIQPVSLSATSLTCSLLLKKNILPITNATERDSPHRIGFERVPSSSTCLKIPNFAPSWRQEPQQTGADTHFSYKSLRNTSDTDSARR